MRTRADVERFRGQLIFAHSDPSYAYLVVHGDRVTPIVPCYDWLTAYNAVVDALDSADALLVTVNGLLDDLAAMPCS